MDAEDWLIKIDRKLTELDVKFNSHLTQHKLVSKLVAGFCSVLAFGFGLLVQFFR